MFARLIGMKYDSNVVLICNFLIMSLSVSLYTYALVNSLLKITVHILCPFFKIGILPFSCWYAVAYMSRSEDLNLDCVLKLPGYFFL